MKQVPTPSPADIFSQATSLLASLTTHAPSPPPTTFTPHQAGPPSHEPLLDALESSLGPIGASLVRSLRRAVGFLYGGAGGQKRGRDWSVRGTALRLRALLKVLFGTPAVEQRKPGAHKTPSTGGRITRWKDGLFGAGVLPDDEVREGMDEVVRLAKEAAHRGVPEAWLLLGDLYLVSFSAASVLDRLACSPAASRRPATSRSPPTHNSHSRRTQKPPSRADFPRRSTSSAFSTAQTTGLRQPESRAKESRAA